MTDEGSGCEAQVEGKGLAFLNSLHRFRKTVTYIRGRYAMKEKDTFQVLLESLLALPERGLG
jgi:hypothetical protein